MSFAQIARSSRLPSAFAAKSNPVSIQQRFITLIDKRKKPNVTKTIDVVLPSTTEAIPKEQLAYNVKRTTVAGWLPVYSDFRNNRSRHLTLIRRIEGDIERLAKDLEQIIPPQNIVVNPLTHSIRLKGNYVNQIRDWLTARGF
ncbi:mitochondrial large subunit ribosomal protein-domain-containing protein [Polychytrium aggregatum]|uniref:mitochondrial large subunit ribosomal protein-domain-containing protein n=1 Tax=Polychytrium aggregatum TaxID=110093 RepID=UPI0022FF2378|nr:mitochondrial large subunit ribosomal protein-domain-containing protein [Polychytrium aggregatum]KAI9204106.1 mitochondrial large subunit ribosomal protein-domain-containing protein [Polychytrium aggregatum]